MHFFYVFTNSPGEVFGWVQPLCRRLTQAFKPVSISIFLTPCQYATGEEARVAASFPGVCSVYLPSETLTCLFSKCADFSTGTVFFMGGDPMHAKRFSKKIGARLVGYFNHRIPTDGFDFFIFKSKGIDLMAEDLAPSPIDDRQGVVLLPGSRPEHLQVALPMMIEMASFYPEVTVMVSPFTSKQQLNLFESLYPDTVFQRMTDPNDLSRYKFALTIPGTNTMQLAYLGIPFLMILPTHDSRILRMDGFLGLLLYVPLLGKLLKFLILNIKVSKSALYALPNQAFGHAVCPELVGRFSIDQARLELKKLINKNTSQYKAVVGKLSELSPQQSALDHLIEYLRN
jgi:hypothetical protein